MGKISEILKNAYLVIKAAFMAFFFIYIVSFIWLIPFNFWLAPAHFDAFAPTTNLGRVIQILSLFISFLAAAFYIHRYQKDLKCLLPTPISNWKDKTGGFIGLFLLTFLAMAIALLVTMGLGLAEFNINEEFSLFSRLFQNINFILLAGVLTRFLIALREEVIYRGVVFRYLFKNTSNLQLALFASSLIFSLDHF